MQKILYTKFKIRKELIMNNEPKNSNIIKTNNNNLPNSQNTENIVDKISDSEKIEFLKEELNLVLYIQKLFFDDLEEQFFIYGVPEELYNELINYEPLKILYEIFEHNNYDEKKNLISEFKKYLKNTIKNKLKGHEMVRQMTESEKQMKIEELQKKQKIANETYKINEKRCIDFCNNILNGEDFFENLKQNPYRLSFEPDEEILDSNIGKEYFNYYEHANKMKQEKNIENFRKFQLDTNNELPTKLENQKKDYSRYKIIGIKPEYELSNISKRQLPTEIFKYLIFSGIMKEKDLELFSTNQFGRTFESTMGDIITEKELPTDEKRRKRYNIIDLSSTPDDIVWSEHKGYNRIHIFKSLQNWKNNNKIYISNQWSKDSIEKFIDFIHKHYSNHISISFSRKDK